MPAVPPYIIEPIWQQFSALLPEREVDHPLGCHRPRVPDRVVFEKLLQILVFGCAYWRIANEQCSATTLRRRRGEWIEEGAMDTLEELAKEAYDRAIGLDPFEVAVDCCITKAPCGARERAKTRWTGVREASNARSLSTPRASRSGSSAPRPIAMTHHFWLRPWTAWRPASLGHCQRGRACIWTAAMTRTLLASAWRNTL
jgi:transposase